MKLKAYQAEHKALIEKTQYLIDHSRIEEDDNLFSDKTWNVKDQFREEEFMYKQPKQSAKGPQVIRKSQPPMVKSPIRPSIAQSAPAKRYVEQPA